MACLGTMEKRYFANNTLYSLVKSVEPTTDFANIYNSQRMGPDLKKKADSSKD